MKVRGIVGVPGAGKTRRVAKEISEYVRANPEKTLPTVMSMTRAAAREIRSRANNRANARTVHSLCFEFLKHSSLEGARVADKSAAATRDFNAWVQPPTFRLTAGLSRHDPYVAGDTAQGDELQQESSRLRHCLVPVEKWPSRVREWHNKWTEFKDDNDYVDFTDIIEIALEESVCCPGNPSAIWLDEAQDTSKLMLSLVRKWAAHKSCEMLTVVGDPRQSIFVWSGADPTLFDRIDDITFLDKSYRVPSVILELANRWGSQLHNTIDAIPVREGGHIHRSTGDWHNPMRAVSALEDANSEGRTAILQASCAFMLKPSIDRLKMLGVPFANPWAAEGKNGGAWNPLRRSTKKNTYTALDRVLAIFAPNADDGREQRNWRLGELNLWASLLHSAENLHRGAKKAMASEDPGQWVTTEMIAEWFADFSILEAALEGDENATMSAFLAALPAEKERKFRYYGTVVRKYGLKGLTDPPKAFVGTCHSFKGAEADDVVIFPDLSVAGRKEWEGEDKESIVRMGYVALTRASRSVTIMARRWKRGHGAINFFGVT